MKSITAVTKGLTKTLSDNSSTILTGTAVAGVLTTSILSIRGTFKALDQIHEYKYEVDHEPGDHYLPTKELVKLTWKCYIPAGLSAAATIAAIIAARQIDARKNAALLSVATLSETAFREYKEKVVQQVGVKKEEAVRDSIAQDRVDASPNSQIVISESGDVLFLDSSSGRYFESTVEKIRKAQNDINAEILNDMYVSQNDFNNAIGLPSNDAGELVGWNLDNLLEVQFSATLKDGKPIAVLSYKKDPVLRFHKVR